MYVRGIDVAIVFSRGGMVMYMYVRGIDVAKVRHKRPLKTWKTNISHLYTLLVWKMYFN
jgi:hypothetical protein